MALKAVRDWFGRQAPEPEVAARLAARVQPEVVEALLPPARTEPASAIWTPERIATADALWGEGYHFPGGEIETVQLAKPLGLSAATTLLLLGAGSGGPALSLTTSFGTLVSAFEANPVLRDAGIERVEARKMSKRIRTESWNPREPVLTPKAYHHGLALEPLNGAQPEPVLTEVTSALKRGGHFMMVELVADQPLNPNEQAVAAWSAQERRDPATLPTQSTITRTLGRLGFDVRTVDDLSQRHMRHTLTGWRAVVRMMEHDRPSPETAARYMQEAELWMLRLRLIKMGLVRLIRWHGIGTKI